VDLCDTAMLFFRFPPNLFAFAKLAPLGAPLAPLYTTFGAPIGQTAIPGSSPADVRSAYIYGLNGNRSKLLQIKEEGVKTAYLSNSRSDLQTYIIGSNPGVNWAPRMYQADPFNIFPAYSVMQAAFTNTTNRSGVIYNPLVVDAGGSFQVAWYSLQISKNPPSVNKVPTPNQISKFFAGSGINFGVFPFIPLKIEDGNSGAGFGSISPTAGGVEIAALYNPGGIDPTPITNLHWIQFLAYSDQTLFSKSQNGPGVAAVETVSGSTIYSSVAGTPLVCGIDCAGKDIDSSYLGRIDYDGISGSASSVAFYDNPFNVADNVLDNSPRNKSDLNMLMNFALPNAPRNEVLFYLFKMFYIDNGTGNVVFAPQNGAGSATPAIMQPGLCYGYTIQDLDNNGKPNPPPGPTGPGFTMMTMTG